MDRGQFEQWFMENISMMAELGVMHYNSPWGRTVRLSLAVNEPLINALSERVAALESALAELQAASAPDAPKKRGRPKKTKVSDD